LPPFAAWSFFLALAGFFVALVLTIKRGARGVVEGLGFVVVSCILGAILYWAWPNHVDEHPFSIFAIFFTALIYLEQSLLALIPAIALGLLTRLARKRRPLNS
jgi:hypothetical protein